MERDLRGQIPIIDTLRGLAASSVCFYHFVCTTAGYIKNETVFTVFSYGKYGVQMFFIISGIVIPLSMINAGYRYEKFHRFIGRRFVRIEPPYLVSVAIGLLYLWARNFIPGTAQTDITPSVRDVFLHLGYLVPFVKGAHWINPVYWTLGVEFQYYLFLALLFPLVLSRNIVLRYTFYAAMLIPVFFLTNPYFFPHWGPVFLLGIVFLLFHVGLVEGVEYSLVSIAAVVLIYLKIGVPDLVVAILTISFIHFFWNKRSALGKFFGNISYSLYLIHAIVGSAFVNFLSHRFVLPWQKFCVIIAGFAVSVFSAWVMYKLIERPSQNLSKKIHV